LAIY
jgi:serine/threonine-protein kinase mTOR